MYISFVSQADILCEMSKRRANSLDFIILITGAVHEGKGNHLKQVLFETVRLLKNGGLLFVQGLPEILPSLGVYLDRYLRFKYWFAIESEIIEKTGLPSVHAAVLLFAK